MLMLKFSELPDWVAQKLEDAGDQQLDIWSDKLFEASTLDDIFD